MDFEDVSLVQTCGICETICDQSEIENHSCFEGYAQYTTDPQTFYFYPVLDDGLTIIRKAGSHGITRCQESMNQQKF